MRFRRPGARPSDAQALAELRARLEGIEQRIAQHDFSQAHDEQRIADAERAIDTLATVATMANRIAATTALVAALPPAGERVSVIMPTRNRAHVLPVALASVRAQSHEAWELVVVDDGSTDGTPELLAAAAREDDRIRVVRAEGGGASAARNIALGHVTGRFVAYLDDDNMMGPHWLRSVVWAFGRHPEATVAYGGRVMDKPAASPPWINLRPWDHHGASAPWVDLEPWDRQVMQVRCLIDQNALAHHAGLPEVHYDVGIDAGSDWDVAIRATADRDPVLIPVVATIYGTEMDDRLSEAAGAVMEWVQVQRRALRMTPLRVLGVDLALPPLGQDEAAQAVREWKARGADVAWCVEGRSVENLGAPRWDNLRRAVAEFCPAMIAVHAAHIVPAQLARIERSGRPFAVVVPSGSDPAHIAPLRDHPLCVGIWEEPGPSIGDLLPALDLVRARAFGLPDPEGLLASAVERESLSLGLPPRAAWAPAQGPAST